MTPPADAPNFFVVGVGRSGTSLMRSFLLSHPDIAIPPETGFLPTLLRLRPLWWAGEQGLRTGLFAKLVFANGRLGHAGYNSVELTRALDQAEPADPGEVITVAYRWLVQDQEWGFESGSGGMIGDKTPSYSAQLDLLLDEFPTAKFIVMSRGHHGLSKSLAGVDWAPNSDRSILAYRRYFERQAARLQNHERVLVVGYERLVDDQDRELSRVLAFLGVAPHPLDHRRYGRSVAKTNLDPTIHSRLDKELSLPQGSVLADGRPALDDRWGVSDFVLYRWFALGQQRHRLRSLSRVVRRAR